MKKLLIPLVFLFWAGLSGAATVVKKDGTTIDAEDTSIDILYIDARVEYTPKGKKWPKYVNFSELDYVSYDGGKYLFKSFAVGNSRVGTPYHVISESEGKVLLARHIVQETQSTNPHRTSRNPTNTYHSYEYIIIDETGAILSQASSRKSDAEGIEGGYEAIKTHFANCPGLLKALEGNGGTDALGKVYMLVNDPVTISCN